jgi:hypothetical protein
VVPYQGIFENFAFSFDHPTSKRKVDVELWVGMKKVRLTYLAFVVKSNPRPHRREASYS